MDHCRALSLTISSHGGIEMTDIEQNNLDQETS